MADKWVTPDSEPTTAQDVTIAVPIHPAYVAILRGLFLELTNPENWQSVGGISPEIAAEWADEILQSFEVAYA